MPSRAICVPVRAWPGPTVSRRPDLPKVVRLFCRMFIHRPACPFATRQTRTSRTTLICIPRRARSMPNTSSAQLACLLYGRVSGTSVFGRCWPLSGWSQSVRTGTGATTDKWRRNVAAVGHVGMQIATVTLSCDMATRTMDHSSGSIRNSDGSLVVPSCQPALTRW